jgi:hypothetical protein
MKYKPPLQGEAEIQALPFKGRVGWGWCWLLAVAENHPLLGPPLEGEEVKATGPPLKGRRLKRQVLP